MDDLHHLLSDKTKIVALPHVSNLLGEVLDIAAVVKAVRDGPAGQCLSAAHRYTASIHRDLLCFNLTRTFISSEFLRWSLFSCSKVSNYI